MTIPPCASGLTSGGIVFFYCTNGIAFSSLTGRAGGLLNKLIIVAFRERPKGVQVIGQYHNRIDPKRRLPFHRTNRFPQRVDMLRQ